uniref:LolA family protein n=1 Tax=Ornithobacterium rhinotracheale TaxID=28251 RepID=UPI0039A583DB
MAKKLSFLILMIGQILLAQSAKSIIEKHFENTGGTASWEQLNTIYIKGEVLMNINAPIPLTIEHRRPYFKRVSFLINGKETLSEGYDGKRAYTFSPEKNQNVPLANYTPDAFETDILNYEKKGFKAEFLGKESLNKHETFHIRLVKNTEKIDYWFHTENYNLVQSEDDTEKIIYSNFKKFGGLKFATHMHYEPKGGQDYIIIFNDIKPNAPIDEKRFKF